MQVDHKQQIPTSDLPTGAINRESIYYRLRGYYPVGPILKNGEPAYGWRSMIGQQHTGVIPCALHLEAAAAIRELVDALATTQYALDVARASLRTRAVGIPAEHAVHNVDVIEKALQLSRHVVMDYDLFKHIPEQTK